jgi:hypothetical protein
VIVKLQVTWEVSSQYLPIFVFDPHTHTLLLETLNLWANGSQICTHTHNILNTKRQLETTLSIILIHLFHKSENFSNIFIKKHHNKTTGAVWTHCKSQTCSETNNSNVSDTRWPAAIQHPHWHHWCPTEGEGQCPSYTNERTEFLLSQDQQSQEEDSAIQMLAHPTKPKKKENIKLLPSWSKALPVKMLSILPGNHQVKPPYESEQYHTPVLLNA